MHLLLLDANNLLCRAFFAGDKIVTSSEKPIGAICALATYINSLIRNLAPTHIAMARDLGANTWRHKLYPQYKKNRIKSDPELYLQFPLVPILAKYMNITVIDNPDFEADDCLATLALQAQPYAHTTIVSTDKDFCQMVNDKIRIYNPHSKSILDEQAVKSKYNLEINQLTDYFALTGDQSDNLPGVSGIGPKTAQIILGHCQKTEFLYDHIDKFAPAIQRKLLNQAECIKLMKTLVTLSTDIVLSTPFTPTFFDHFLLKKDYNISIQALKNFFN